MGWETGISLGFNALQGFNKMQAGKAEASAIEQQGENVAQNEADTTVRKLGSLETSFAHGGIALDNLGGTAAIFQQAAKQGYTNIHRTIDNANTEAQNSFNAARTSSLESIASGFQKFGVPGGIGSTVTEQAAYALNDMGFGNTAYDMLDPSPGGNYRY